jgi:putative colanic acid biosynthesis acetyltransferase WcaB
MTFFKFVFQDWRANKGNAKGRAILFFFRIANFCTKRKIYFYLGLPYIIFYRVIIQWIFTLEIPWNLKVGKSLALFHAEALVINKGVIIGDNCTLRHCTTIGTKQNRDGTMSAAPVIGNNVDVGSNACIIGNIHINDNVKIGSGSVVVKNVDGNCIVAGNPAVEKGKL